MPGIAASSNTLSSLTSPLYVANTDHNHGSPTSANMQSEQIPRNPIEQSLARTHSNCHYQWLLEEKRNMVRSSFLAKKQNQDLVFWVGKVSEAIKNDPTPRNELDICLRPLGSPLPSLAIVSGWTEAYGKMFSDVQSWIKLGNGGIRKVFLLRWSKTPSHEVGCDLEVYEWDESTRGVRLSQKEVDKIVLPEIDEVREVKVLFGEIFGRRFPDADYNSTYPFSLGRLRAIAKKVIEEDGYRYVLETAASDRKTGEETENSGNPGNNSLPSSAHVLDRSTVGASVISPDEPNAEITSEDTHQVLDAAEDISSVADSPGKTELSLHGPDRAGPVGSPELQNEANRGGGTGSEPLGRASESPRPLEDPHFPNAPENIGATGEDSIHSSGAAPRILAKQSTPLSSSQGSDVSDTSYTSDISDNSDAGVDQDTSASVETGPVTSPRVDSESLGEVPPSLGIDIPEASRDGDAVTDPESPEGVNPPHVKSAGIGGPEALENGEGTVEVSDPEAHPKPSGDASSALISPQPSEVSRVAQATDSTEKINETATVRAGPSSLEELTPTEASLQDSITPVTGSALKDELSVLVDGAMDDTINGGVPLPGDIVSPKLPSGFATQNTSSDAALGGVQGGVGNFEVANPEVVEDVFMDIEEFRVHEVQRREETERRRVLECSECRRASAQGHLGRESNENVPARDSISLEGGGNQQSKVDTQSNSGLFSYFSSFFRGAASPTPPTTPPRASNAGVHEAADTVVTPQEATVPAIKITSPRQPKVRNGKEVSWQDLVDRTNRGKRGSSGSSGSLEESSPSRLFSSPGIAEGSSAAGGGPYAGDPLGIGIPFGDRVYSLMSAEARTSEHSASDGRVSGAEAIPLIRTSPASEHYEESPFADIRDGEVQVVNGAVNRATTPSAIRSPFFPNFFQWSDTQRTPFSEPSSMRKGAPTPAIGPLGEHRSPMISRTPCVGAESPLPSGPASCVHTSSFIGGHGPATITTESSSPNNFGSLRGGGGLTGRTRPVNGRLAPPHGPPGASARGTQSGRYQSVVQEEREEFAHGFMDESSRINFERFSQLEDLIKRFAVKHFNRLPSSLSVSSASLDTSPFPPEFLCSSPLGNRLRTAAVQNIVCRHLVNNIFSAVVPSLCFNMEVIAGELMKLDPLKQALWQVLTVEALEALPQYEAAAAKLRQKTVNEILVSIGAMSDSPVASLAESLHGLVKFAQDAWEPTFKSKAQTIPEVDIENGTANFKMDPKDSRLRGSSGLQGEGITRPVLCLFPAIYQIADGRDILIAPGRALFSDLYHSAETELQAKLKPWNSGQRHDRRASFMRPPFVHRSTRPPTSPESQSGRWSPRRMSHEHFDHNQWCSHPNDNEDGAIDFWDVSMHLKEYSPEALRHGRRRSTGSETFSESRSPYLGRNRSFNGSRWESVYSSRQESVYERQGPRGRREHHYGGRRESFQGSGDHYWR
ncbi:unnamed protein product [Tuber aestivum]|uniref:Uncharacterized protein n=1 Tax=Tuber aestivum TaxID=59557 RepID=A0A292PYH9_9PEZI|nr:unnamed protein product [Tuber aestivum]